MSTNREIIIDEINKRINHDGERYFVNNGSGSDSFTTNHLNKIRRLYNITRNVEILYCYKFEFLVEGDFFTAARNYIFSVLILEDGIHLRKIEETTGWDKSSDFVEYILWENIDNMDLWYDVDKDTQDKNYFIKFYLKDSNDFIEVPTNLFGFFMEDEDENGNFIIDMILNIKDKINSSYDESDSVFSEALEKISDAHLKRDNSICLELIKSFTSTFDYNFLKEHEIITFYEVLFMNAYSLKNLGNQKEALKILNQKMINFEYSVEYRDELCRIYRLRGKIKEELNDLTGALQDCQIAIDYSDDDEELVLLSERLELTYSKYNESFWNLKFDDRKVLLINQEIKPSLSSDLIVLQKSNLPENIKFPFSHPKVQEVYVGHPYIKESYLPFSTFEESLFNDRFEEFSYFIQCLGAKSMTIKVIKGNEITNSYNLSKNIDSKVSAMKIKGNVSYDKSNNGDSNEVSGSSRTRTQKFSPTKKPYIPDNLLWYSHETSWHRLYQQRINGNILKHHDFMSSKNSYSINDNEKSKVKVAFENFFIGAEVEINSLIEHNFNQRETTEWEIEIEFESINNLNEVNSDNVKEAVNTTFKNNENEYVDEINFMLEDDGVIDDKERRILDRLSSRLGISKEDAVRIENEILLNGNLNENEKEYLEEFQELLNEGDITDKERRILNRFANRLDISDDRVIQIEKLKIKVSSN